MYRQFRESLHSLFERSRVMADTIPLMLAVEVGVATGVAAVFFIWLIRRIREFTAQIRLDYGVLAGLGLMIAAGFFIGWMIKRYVPEAQGSGIPDVMEAVAIRRGRIRFIVAPLKILLSALTIGVGGSVGREGPIVQVGAAFGSAQGRWLHFSEDRVKIFVASGAAAGIAAAFNAPIAGTMFAMEVILGQFNNRNLGMIVTAAVSATIVSRALLGDNPAFVIPVHRLNGILELPIYMVMAVICGLFAIGFIGLLYKSEDVFGRFFRSMPARAAAGLGLTGIVAIIEPDVLVSGLEFIGEAIARDEVLTINTMAWLFALKAITTCLTLGSGNSGGMFAPVLFMGAMIGGITGEVAAGIWPETVTDPGAFAVVGMAAMLSASVHAPISSIIIVVEMSNDYHLIIPLLIAVNISTIISDIIQPDSIYTRKLTRRGINIQRGQDIDVLQSVRVEEVMTRDYTVVTPDTTLDEMMLLFHETHHHGFPIVDQHRYLIGIISLSDVERAQAAGVPGDTLVTEFGTTNGVITVFPDDPIYTALGHMTRLEIGRLPVVSREQQGLFLGIVRRSNIFRAYEIGIVRKTTERHRLEHFKLRNVDGNAFIEVKVSPEAPMVGHPLSQFPYSDSCLLVSVRRGNQALIARGDTVIKAGDLVTAYASVSTHDVVRAQFAPATVAEEQRAEGS